MIICIYIYTYVYIYIYTYFPKVSKVFDDSIGYLKLLDLASDRSGFASGIKPANGVKRKIFSERRYLQKSYLVFLATSR